MLLTEPFKALPETALMVEMLERLSMPATGSRPVVILDAGFASKANVALLKDRGMSYLISLITS